MIQAGTDVNQQNLDGYTVLLRGGGGIKIIYINVGNAMILAGSDVNHYDSMGDTALIYGIKII